MAPIKSFLIRLTNHNPVKAQSDDCDNYLAVLGFLLVAIPAVTTYGMFSTLHYAAGMPDHLVIPITITTWVMTSALEFWIVSSRRENDRILTPKLFLRLLFTVVTTALVMFGVVASLTDKEVTSETSSTAIRNAQQAQQTAEAPLQALITADAKSVNTLQADIDAVPERREKLVNNWQAKWLTPCSNSQRYTCGGKDIRHGPGAATALTALRAFNKQASTEVPRKQAEITRLTAEIVADITKRDTAGETAYRIANAGVGIGSKSSAMWREFTRTPVLWILAAMVALWDCLALAIKISMPMTVFDLEYQDRKRNQLANAAGATDAQSARIRTATTLEVARIQSYEKIAAARIEEDEQTELARVRRDGQAQREREDAPDEDTHTGGRQDPSDAVTSGQPGRGTAQRLAVAGGSAALALTAGALLTWNSGHDTDAPKQTVTTQPTAPAAAQGRPVEISASFAAYKIPGPSHKLASAARSYMSGPGKPILHIHTNARSTVSHYTPASCTRLKQSVSKPAAFLAAAAMSPDETLKEIALDELHDVASIANCPTAPDAAIRHLAGTDALLHQRLRQDEVIA